MADGLSFAGELEAQVEGLERLLARGDEIAAMRAAKGGHLGQASRERLNVLATRLDGLGRHARSLAAGDAPVHEATREARELIDVFKQRRSE